MHISLQVRQWELQRLSVVLFMEASFPCVKFKHNSGEIKGTVMYDLKRKTTKKEDRYFIKVIWLVHTATLFDLHEKVYIYVMINVRLYEQVIEKLDTSTRFKIIDESCILGHIPTFVTKQCPDNLVSSITFVVMASIPSLSVQARWLQKKKKKLLEKHRPDSNDLLFLIPEILLFFPLRDSRELCSFRYVESFP